MAIVWIDGFETYVGTDPLIRRYENVVLTQLTPNAAVSSTETGRMGFGYALRFTGTTFTTPALPSHGTYILSFAFWNAITNPGEYDWIKLWQGSPANSGNAPGIKLTFNPSTHLISLYDTSNGLVT